MPIPDASLLCQGFCRLGRALVVWALLLLAAWSPATAQDAVPLPPRAERAGEERVREVYEGRVSRVSDGDTLWVKPLAGGRYRKLRLDGLDAPEVCQSDGPAARDALAQRVLDQVVTVQVRAFDDFGRAVARLESDGTDVGAWLVRQGHAWSSRWRGKPVAYADEEAMARSQRLGVFQIPDAEEPRAFRRRHGPCPNPSVRDVEMSSQRD